VHEINVLLERLRRALEAERSFTADAAHELRTPLAVIAIQAHLLAQSCQGAAEAVRDLQEGVERAARLVRQLLTMARLDAQGLSLQQRHEDFDALIRERLAVLAQRGLEKQIEVAMFSPSGLTVPLDRESFALVIDNLIENAFRYTPAGGHVHVNLQSSATHVMLRIADDGPGIPPAEHERVFQRFYRLPGMETAGSGLGLAIVKRIVTLHQATIRLAPGLNGRGLGVEIRWLRQGRSNLHPESQKV
jgi:signal transduction histidine kinase